jgi:hypothetical protein
VLMTTDNPEGLDPLLSRVWCIQVPRSDLTDASLIADAQKQ